MGCSGARFPQDLEFAWGMDQGNPGQGQRFKGPFRQALALRSQGLTIDQQQIQITPHSHRLGLIATRPWQRPGSPGSWQRAIDRLCAFISRT